MRPRLVPLAAAALASALSCALPGLARADSLAATLGMPLTEVSHTVDVRLADGVALYTVTRRLKNAGEKHEEASLWISLPPGAVATGLRIHDAAKGVWYDADLMDRDAAAALYEELTGVGPHHPKDPALLWWEGQGILILQVFPIVPGGESTVEYTLTVPTIYEDGRLVLYYPDRAPAEPGAPALAAPLVRVDRALGASPATRVIRAPGVEDEPLPPDDDPDAAEGGVSDATWWWGDAERWLRVTLPPPPIDTAAARYGAFPVRYGRNLWRLEVDAAPVLEPAPRDARVVFVIDGSWTEGEEGVADQLALVRGYLANLPDARFEVVVARRRAERLFGAFVRAADAGRALGKVARPRLAPGNGSSLDAGLAVAAEALAGEQRPARVVVMTDGLMRDAMTTPLALAALARAPAGTVVHVVLRGADERQDGGALGERRDDDHVLAPLAAAYGGVLLAISGQAQGGGGELAAVTRGLVRPIRIDGFAIEARGVPSELLTAPARLWEGTRFTRTLIAPAAAAKVTLRGRVWAREWTREVPVAAGFAARLPALAFGHAVADELDAEEQALVAFAGKAVSPVTSYLAIEPGTRPSNAGILRGGYGSGDAYGSGGYGLIGTGVGGGGAADTTDRVGLLADWLEPGAAACARRARVGGLSAQVRFETTYDEIVDVAVEGAPGASVAACLADAAWALRLDAEFHAVHDRIDVPIQVSAAAPTAGR